MGDDAFTGSDGTFCGQGMTAGDAWPVAASARLSYRGNGPGLSASLAAPETVIVDGGGKLIMTDDTRIREISAQGARGNTGIEFAISSADAEARRR